MRVRIKHRRLAKAIADSPLTQNRWAQKLGISRGHLSNLVNGRYLYPGPKTRRRLMEVFGLGFDELFTVEMPEGRAAAPTTPPAIPQENRMDWIPRLSDIRHAARRALRQPLPSLFTVATLAVAIGANTAVFGVVNAVLFRPLPVEKPEELVNVYTTSADGTGFNANAFPDFEELRLVDDPVRGWLGYGGFMGAFSTGEAAESVFGEMVTENYFGLLGIQPLLGRSFRPGEGASGSAPLALISEGLWRRRFGADPSAVGGPIFINGRRFELIGVVPREFQGLLVRGVPMDLWVTLAFRDLLRSDADDRSNRWLHVKARLGRPQDLAAAQQAANAVAESLSRRYPAGNEGRGFRLLPTTSVYFHPDGDQAVRILAVVLLAATALVLLVACSNVANLTLSSLSKRKADIAVRRALGASRTRLTREFTLESLLLALCGGAVGLPLAYALARLLVDRLPRLPVPVRFDLPLDLSVALFALGICLASGLFLGLVPSWRMAKGNEADLLQGRHSLRRRRAFGLRNIFLVPQVALCLCLLIVSGLFGRSVFLANSTDPGFDYRRTAMIAFQLGQSGYSDEAASAFQDRLQRGVSALPSVESVALSRWIPLSALYGSSTSSLEVDGETVVTELAEVGEGFFRTMGIPILRGRAFQSRDFVPGSAAVIVSASAARRLWGDEDPLGRTLRGGGDDGLLLEVAGVAADTKVQTLGESSSTLVYRPLTEGQSGLVRLLVRTDGDPGRLLPSLRAELRELDDQVALFESKTLGDHVAVTLFPHRMAALISASLGGAALLLAAVGVFGLASFGVAKRRHELGVRLALGSTTRRLLWMLVGDGMRVSAVGLVLGLALSALVARGLSSLLFGVGALDPTTFLIVPLFLLAVVAAASYFPARKAKRIQPADLLRDG